MAESPESLFPTSLLLSCAKHVQCMCIITVCPSASLPPLVVVALLLTALIIRGGPKGVPDPLLPAKGKSAVLAVLCELK